MVKIGIFEDKKEDLIVRYESLISKGDHEVHVFFDLSSYKSPGDRANITATIMEHGFNPNRLYFDLSEVPETDIDFIDGLGGDCFEVADRRGKSRSFIVTSSGILHRKAETNGYQTANESDIEGIVNSL